MQELKDLLFEVRDEKIAIITINRPEVRNAMTANTWTEFNLCLDEVEANPAIRVLIITGAGEKSFMAGADIVTLKTRDGLRRLAIRAVVYGELVGHNVRYYLADGTTLESMSVRTAFRGAVAQFLEYDRFVLCSASFLVNLSYVESIDAAGLRLRGGQVLPLSRSLRSEVTKRWLDHHLKGGTSPC